LSEENERVSRTWLLARTFFARFFESELLPPGLPQAQLVIWSLALFAAPGVLLPIRLSGAYALLQHDPALLARVLHGHRLIFIMMSMTGMGLVALVLWQNVFPDRRDARLLGVLPLTPRALVAGRLLAVSMLAGVFLIGINAIPTAIYGLLAGYYGAAHALLGVVAHAGATACAGAFVFFLLVAIQGVWLNLGKQSADRLALAMQLVFMVTLLFHAASLGRLIGLTGADLQHIAADSRFKWLPAFWFAGLYDVIGGRPGPGSAALAIRGLLATLFVVSTAAGMLALTHGRLMRLALEGRAARRGSRGRRSMLDAVAALVCRGAIARAVFLFTIRTLMRSRSHRMLLGIYAGVAAAMIAATLGPIALRAGLAGFRQPGVAALAAPLVLLFFLVTGTSVMMAIPVEPKANWVFRLLEPANRVAALAGARNALLVTIVTPIALVAGMSAAWLWSPWLGVAHGLVCAGMGWALAELLLIRARKIPFTCTWFAGQSRAKLWPFYLIACSNYCFTTAAIELSILDRPRHLAIFLLLLALVISGLARVRARALTAPPGLRFEEEDPTAIFEGFSLSEGLAARTPAPVSRSRPALGSAAAPHDAG
jgi:hypothetical protein